jgi:hypothetical protein
MAQGSTRLARGVAYAKYVNERYGASRAMVIVPACGHNGRCMFTGSAALKLLSRAMSVRLALLLVFDLWAKYLARLIAKRSGPRRPTWDDRRKRSSRLAAINADLVSIL